MNLPFSAPWSRVEMIMGVHFTVIVDHDIRDTSLDTVRARFVPLVPIFEELWEQEQPGVWRDVSEPGSARPYLFSTPWHCTLHIGTAALKLHHFTRFSAFVGDVTIQDSLRRFSRELAQLFGQRRALYAPCEGIGDEIADWLHDGLSLADMEARLRQRSNPPATIAELASRSPSDLRYYIDEF